MAPTFVPRSEYLCPFTNITHKYAADSDEFISYCDSLFDRLENGESLNLAVDCEGEDLGCKQGSLRLVQIAEVFPGVSLQQSSLPTPAMEDCVCPGFLLPCPAPAAAATALCRVLEHPKALTLTFDATNDLIGLQTDLGVKVDHVTAFDAQMAYMELTDDPILTTRVPGLGKVLAGHPLYKMSESLKSRMHKRFDASGYLHPGDSWPYVVSHEMMAYAAGDIFLTAAVAAEALTINSYSHIIRCSKKRADAVTERSTLCHLERQLQFANLSANRMKAYCNCPTTFTFDRSRSAAVILRIKLLQNAETMMEGHREGLGITVSMGIAKRAANFLRQQIESDRDLLQRLYDETSQSVDEEIPAVEETAEVTEETAQATEEAVQPVEELAAQVENM